VSLNNNGSICRSDVHGSFAGKESSRVFLKCKGPSKEICVSTSTEKSTQVRLNDYGGTGLTQM